MVTAFPQCLRKIATCVYKTGGEDRIDLLHFCAIHTQVAAVSSSTVNATSTSHNESLLMPVVGEMDFDDLQVREFSTSIFNAIIAHTRISVGRILPIACPQQLQIV